MKRCPSQYRCPVEATIELIGGKYKAVILWHLIDRTLRFHELQKLVSQATAKMLTQQLRELEAGGLIHRQVYPVIPPKVEYSLSDFGRSIVPILDVMCNWGSTYLNRLYVCADSGRPAALEFETGLPANGRNSQ